MQSLPPEEQNDDLLIGLESSDDAGVLRLRDDFALVQSVDYFTPIVDDPYWYGRIAAANALSDIYAMGGHPLTVMNLAGFPADRLDLSELGHILRGAADKTREAGAVLVGGHTLEDNEPKFGLAVTGAVHPDRVLPNSGSRPGDRLVLTKPIGVGILTTALKREALSADEVERVTQVMATLNNVTEPMVAAGAHACTDVTGFGLLGHAYEMARAGRVGFRIEASRVPILDGARRCAEAGMVPGGSRKNQAWLKEVLRIDAAVDPITRVILCDAVTSGGLLISVPEAETDSLVASLEARHTWAAAVIGQVVSDHPGRIEVRP